MESRIYLAGFMGCGKSTLGPIVANVLGYAFLDLDELIEKEEGRSIPQIFAEEGESVFRSLEAEHLRNTGSMQRVIVALGGGALAVEENLEWALGHGLVVYLSVPLDQLVARLTKGRGARPMLRDEAGKQPSTEVLRTRIRQLMQEREPFYRRADIVVDVGGRRVGLAVDTVVKALREYGLK